MDSHAVREIPCVIFRACPYLSVSTTTLAHQVAKGVIMLACELAAHFVVQTPVSSWIPCGFAAHFVAREPVS